jgi:hypothetical protein
MAVQYHKEGKTYALGLVKTGIAWSTDKDTKFANPEGASLEEGK